MSRFEEGLERFADKLENSGYEYCFDDWFRAGEGWPELTADQMADELGFSLALVEEYIRRCRAGQNWSS